MSGIVYAAEKKEIAVSVNCPEDLTLSHDSKWTSEALFNLLDNAVKYTPAGGNISVTVEQWEMYIKVDIRDTGNGYLLSLIKLPSSGVSTGRKKFTMHRALVSDCTLPVRSSPDRVDISK